jgi:hypothetical protein
MRVLQITHVVLSFTTANEYQVAINSINDTWQVNRRDWSSRNGSPKLLFFWSLDNTELLTIGAEIIECCAAL